MNLYNRCYALVALLLGSITLVQAQDVRHYLESIRDNKAALTMFFAQMPKGGDLHHHYSGSVYTETYIDFVVNNNYFIDLTTLQVSETRDTQGRMVNFQSLQPFQLASIKQQLMQKWSVKDYNGLSYPSDKQFFETFPNFNVAVSKTFDEGLQEIKQRAIREHVSYIETMFTSIYAPFDFSRTKPYQQRLDDINTRQHHEELAPVLKELTEIFNNDSSLHKSITAFNNNLHDRHQRLALEDSLFTMRYQNYVARVSDNPVSFFKSLWVAFESANRSPLIVGVNIVAPEDHELSMKYYWLHMQMFAYLGAQYPNVRYAMHAGELALGMVKPEDLTWHINAAVFDARAQRIGHGVDLPYEHKADALLRYMQQQKIAVEINLTSNEFILKVKDDRHPIMLYKNYNVPIVISTDDAGVLRSNLTEQYVLLANRYPQISYDDIKQMVFNSIDYSFIEEDAVKQRLRNQLVQQFAAFENQFSK
jgi:adenosine deaminase